MNILIFHPANHAAKDLESLVEAHALEGNKVFLLTLAEPGVLHENCLRLKAYKAESLQLDSPSFFNKVKMLAAYLKQNEIDIVYSNLQQCSIISAFTRYLVKSKIIACRHFSDSVTNYGTWKEKLAEKIISRLTERITVISRYSFGHTTDIEGVNPAKVRLIPLGYNFDLLKRSDPASSLEIRNRYKSKLLLVQAGRLISLKRCEVSIMAMSKLIEQGKDIQLIFAGDGPLKNSLDQKVKELGLEKHIHFCGFVRNLEDYIGAADLVIHPSNSEASCHMPKEAALNNKTIIACKGVGDFDDYLEDGKNAFLISKTNTEVELVNLVSRIYEDPSILDNMPGNLEEAVRKMFHINSVFPLHKQMIKELKR
jgi:L-malate glycosyltransferase